MPDIVIGKFMDVHALEAAAKNFAVHYDPELVDEPEQLNNCWMMPKC